ncbi:MAG: peptide ligase PGM1-related protein, partial [Acidimicrobiia bacterium]
VLDRPQILEEIQSLIPDRDRAHLVPFMSTWDDRELAMRLGIPMYGADPAHVTLGTKTEARRLFRSAGVRHPVGVEGIHGRQDLRDAIIELMGHDAAPRRVIVKLNEGVSGFGNATVDLGRLGSRPSPRDVDALLDELPTHEAIGGVDHFMRLLESEGGVVEQMVEGRSVESPSVQLRITPLGEVEVLSTHDQILGGPSGQVFMGSRFPADPRYAAKISESAALVGAQLAVRGVIGRFAIDYVVVERSDHLWDEYAIELNLRKGGTTHPFLTLQFLTDGAYDPERAVFLAPDGAEKHYVASDHVEIDGLEVFRPRDLLDLVSLHGLHFDQTTMTGAVFHMLSAMPTHGLVGVTCIENTAEAAADLYGRVLEFLTEQVGLLRS